MLDDDIPQLSETPHAGIVIRTAPDHMRLQRVQPRKLLPDRGYLAYLPPVMYRLIRLEQVVVMLFTIKRTPRNTHKKKH